MFLNLLASYTDVIETEDSTLYAYNDVWTAFAKSALMNVFLYAAIAIAVILLAVGIIVRFKKPESLSAFLKTAIAFAVGFSATVIAAMVSLEFYDMYENGYVFDLILWPSVALCAVVLLSIAVCYISNLFGKKAFKISLIVCASLFAAAIIAFIVCLSVYYAGGNAADNNFGEGANAPVNNLALYLSSLGLIAVIALITIFMGKGEKKGFDTKTISFAAVCIAMSFALSYIRIIAMPQGGSVTLASLLPLMVFSYMFGVRKGVFAGAIYGILQAVQDPWLLHPAQFLLDYPVAFAAIGVTGMFKKIPALNRIPQLSFALGAVVASALRFICHVFSGVFAFSQYALWENMNPWIHSLAYNSFVFVDIAIVIVVGILVFSSKTFLREMNRYTGQTAPQPVKEDESTTAADNK